MKKGRTRRSIKKKAKEVLIYYSNLNGLKTKLNSTKGIIEKLAPKLIVLCETKLPSDAVLKNMLPEYDINHSPTKIGQSGIAIAVK